MRRYFPGLLLVMTLPAAADERFTGPWPMDELKRAPASSVSEPDPATGLREVFYENVPLDGKPARVFAYYAVPRTGEGPFPAMVLVHGGGGKAFPEWARLWADRGYAAIAMDLSGRGPDGERLPDGGPDQSDEEKFRDFEPEEVGRMWSYHAVAAAVRAHSFLAARPEVDRDRIGVTGISWGGYLTCIVAGIDDRVKVAVPVYGCGFLDENSAWIPRFEEMGEARTRRWCDLFDPSRYLPGVSCPILFVNGTNDFAYPLDSYRKSYRLVEGPVDLCITVGMLHGHPQGWAPEEIGLFVESILEGGTPPPRLTAPEIDGGSGRISARVASNRSYGKAKLHYTTDSGAWQERSWSTIDAEIGDSRVEAELPRERPIVAFFTVEDDRGAVASSPHVTAGK
ncbi:alpha/beta hydrolase family protein [Tautonia marina]|uniref:alpha/beta hydrolase family protein n=1 Tax=Tautonia marina TaxID=2653855 RepID=UPI00126068FD|nr:acetylxylan esterase [Tautonia marina]